jgi:hypothetical protein
MPNANSAMPPRIIRTAPIASASNTFEPWMNSQRGLSGTFRRTTRITVPSANPKTKQIRQSRNGEKTCSATTDSNAPAAAPNQ